MRIDEVHCNHHLQASHVPFFAQVLKSGTWTTWFPKKFKPIWVVFSTKNSYFSDIRLQSNCPATYQIQRKRGFRVWVKNQVEIFGDKVRRGRGMVDWMVWISRLAFGLIRWLVPISSTANTHFSQPVMLGPGGTKNDSYYIFLDANLHLKHWWVICCSSSHDLDGAATQIAIPGNYELILP